MVSTIKGLSLEEVKSKHTAGLSNKAIDSVSPSLGQIIFRNTFNLINIFLTPLLIMLVYFAKYKEVFVIIVFAVINSLISMWDEIRIKRRLDEIQVDFAKKIRVIREGKEFEILADEIVIGDYVKIIEGEGVPTDGEIVYENTLQVDDSLLTGESDYISKQAGERILAGSFVVTGECVYVVTGVGQENYVNVLGAQSKSFRKEKSNLQQIGDKLTIFFVISAIVFGFIAYTSAILLGFDVEAAILPLVSTVALIVPQTLIFLFTFTFSVSVLKLSRMGVLVQRGSAIESLANLDVLCFDKTGTITTNEMNVVATKYWNTNEEELGSYMAFIKDKVFGKNKTFQAIAKYFGEHEPIKAEKYAQNPFTSKTKIAKNQFVVAGDNTPTQLIYGAQSSVVDYVDQEIKTEVIQYIQREEAQGKRIILGIIGNEATDIEQDTKFVTKKVWVISMKEEFNKGISDVIKRFKEIGTDLKIISGDSFLSVKRVLESVGIEMDNAIDLSQENIDISLAANKYNVFARSRPEDKLAIVRALQSQGKKVGMVGDGVNDVLALKLSNLSIAMESGSKMARDVSDIVLINNNFSLVPEILFEAENIIANLKFMNKLFLSKTFHAMVFVVICLLLGLVFPLLPASILIYGFLGSSLPSYVVAFWRRSISGSSSFLREVMPYSLLSGIVSAVSSGVIYYYTQNYDAVYFNTAIMYGALIFSALFAVEQLWSSGYLKRWYEVVASVTFIILGSCLPLPIPFLQTYYDITVMDAETWKFLFVVSGFFFLVYLLLKLMWDRVFLLPVSSYLKRKTN